MIGELEYKGISLEEIVEKAKKGFGNFLNSNNVKFVGIELHFLIDDEIQVKIGSFAKGYDPNNYEEVIHEKWRVND